MGYCKAYGKFEINLTIVRKRDSLNNLRRFIKPLSYVGLMEEHTVSSRTQFLPDILKSVPSEPASLRGATSASMW